ncbi:MAG: hypothetical protein ACOX2F_11765 [bacterium]
MDGTIWGALIAGFFSALSVLVSGLINYKIISKQFRANRLEKNLLKVYENIEAFYEIEELYIEEVLKLRESGSKNSIKREFRNKLSDSVDKRIDPQVTSPSIVERQINRLSK